MCVSFFKVKAIISSPDKEENTQNKKNIKIKITHEKEIKRFKGSLHRNAFRNIEQMGMFLGK